MATSPGMLGGYFRSLMNTDMYKAGKGNLLRWGTFGAVMLLVLAAMYSWYAIFVGSSGLQKWGVPVAFGLVAAWLTFRLIQFPIFAEFLITTEIEINKVAWPNRGDLKISTMVVLLVTVLFSLFLFATDWFWQFVLWSIGILKLSWGAVDNPNA